MTKEQKLNIKKFKCVDKGQMEADYYHADWMFIKAETRNKAKYKYSKIAETEYKDAICTVVKEGCVKFCVDIL